MALFRDLDLLQLDPEFTEKLKKTALSVAIAEVAEKPQGPIGSLAQVAQAQAQPQAGRPAIIDAAIQAPVRGTAEALPPRREVAQPPIPPQAQELSLAKKEDRLPQAQVEAQPAARPAARREFAPAISHNPFEVLLNVLSGGGYGEGQTARRTQDEARAAKNDTYNALLDRGMDETLARATVGNPQLMQAVLPAIFGANKKDWQLGEVFNEDGKKIKVLWNKNDPKQMVPMGFAAPSAEETMVTRLEKQDEIKRGQEQNKADIKTIAEAKAAGNQGNELVSQVEQMRTLRKGVNYSGLPFGISGMTSKIAGLFGYGEGQAVANLAMQMQGTIRQKGEGAVSNYERQLFEDRSPGLSMSDAGAELVLSGMEAVGRRKAEKAKFLEAFKRENRSLDGSEEAWSTFMSEKPILGEAPEGGIKVNKDNIGSWREYLKQRDPAGQAQTAPSAPKPANRFKFNTSTGEFE